MKQLTTFKLLSFVTLSITAFPAFTMDNNYLKESRFIELYKRYKTSEQYYDKPKTKRLNRNHIPKKECKHEITTYEYLGNLGSLEDFATPNPYKKAIVKKHTDDNTVSATFKFYITDKELNDPRNWVPHIEIRGKKY